MKKKLDLGNRTLEDLPPYLRHLGLQEGFRYISEMNKKNILNTEKVEKKEELIRS